MKGGILEVLLVSAEGLKSGRILGSAHQYVIIQCGSQTSKSKITSGKDGRIWWNEKFTFKLPSMEWQHLTQLRLTIMEKDKLLEDCSVGETIVHLTGVLREGSRIGSVELKPSPYNVVLEDGTYEGELKVGLKCISNVELETETENRTGKAVPEKQSVPIYRTILNFTLRRIRWPRLFFLQNRMKPKETRKHN